MNLISTGPANLRACAHFARYEGKGWNEIAVHATVPLAGVGDVPTTYARHGITLTLVDVVTAEQIAAEEAAA